MTFPNRSFVSDSFNDLRFGIVKSIFSLFCVQLPLFCRPANWASKYTSYLSHPDCVYPCFLCTLLFQLIKIGSVDDSFLSKASSSVPKNSILLIEDIDCAFPVREDADDAPLTNNQSSSFGFVGPGYGPGMGRKSAVTLSGLLNVIDGIGSEEGKLFFATVCLCSSH